MDVPAAPDSDPAAAKPAVKARRKRGGRASEEAVLSISVAIANWQAKVGWFCAMWGLLPVAGLPLGISAAALGILGYRRVRQRPEDLGIRHAVGAMLLGVIEILVNLAGLACIARGIVELTE